MEWINGFKVSDIESIRKLKINKSTLATRLAAIFSKQIFEYDFSISLHLLYLGTALCTVTLVGFHI
jgi:hypothetical protein